MQIGNVLSAPISYMDRMLLAFGTLGGGSNLAPHAATTRVAYIVPANRRALISFLSITMIRSTAAAPAAQAAVQCIYTPSGGADQEFSRLTIRGNAIDDGIRMLLPANLLLFAGDQLRIVTFDISTGGGFDIFMGIAGNEYTP